jgi:hypothetical protein
MGVQTTTGRLQPDGVADVDQNQSSRFTLAALAATDACGELHGSRPYVQLLRID